MGRGGACAYPRGSSERSEGGGARSAYPSRLEGRALLMIIVSKWTARGPRRAKRRRARNMRKATSIPGCRFVVHCVVMTLRSRGGAGRHTRLLSRQPLRLRQLSAQLSRCASQHARRVQPAACDAYTENRPAAQPPPAKIGDRARGTARGLAHQPAAGASLGGDSGGETARSAHRLPGADHRTWAIGGGSRK